jgi:geranylgeranyl diphosphate synthase type II
MIPDPLNQSIEWGMTYVTFAPSKRVRPLLVLKAHEIFSKPDDDCYLLASAIELIHTYSLVHDDLPCMDNDSVRRGLPTLHVLKNEAYAVLVGDALLTRVMGILARYSKSHHLNRILQTVYKKAGDQGMIYGQYLDMEGENRNLELDAINEINENKTSRLLELSLLLGGINAGASDPVLNQLEDLGKIFGLLFQIKDDILDIEGDASVIGKPVGSDESNSKSSIPLIIGMDQAKKLLNEYKIEAQDLIRQLPSNRDFFNHFVDFLISREK